MKNLTVYVVFVVVVVAIGALIGVNNVPGEWYQSLQKPFFNPPNWIFGPVWTTLYVLIGIAGARTWIRKRMGTRMRLWFTQMALNFLWSPIFFGMPSPAGALIIIIPMLVCILAFIALTYRRDRISMWLFVPYALWVAFATVLNASIGILN
ncbi:Tryptophan-rich sensory protein [Rhizobium rhizogenes]|uniref:Tryptophan-rich sensory protein n=1 Tax=Rhizobium rhizogenes TaxID=359 RepID=A0AAN2A6R8_RHIRH|nr:MULTISPECIES: TspO/MBR family protein [Rhizobium/Agrobacterium group]AQS62876.1 tryptophan-rich sensory protein [Rhizobium rhizogenes]MCZ7442047.1 tryptophan-rich sensory protein [Rhizobium rhizogenes]NSZ77745.1 tryptophan-rich sensory protein [Agrobacterium tumefaciens]OAM64658.1 sensor histidine kinase [Rhizobium rhizogenes]CAD0214396.1 Tryptophan-rich sensory protein [Rhizobium rhizogenes]